jgi:hypothetical protein
MFDSSLPINNPIKNSSTSEYGGEGYLLYKIRLKNKKPYIIRLEKYPNNLYFIKFYPKNHESNPNKFKLRLNQKIELTRLIATCITLAKNMLSNNPDCCFGFFGQWDKNDIVSENELINSEYVVSQRYRIYKTVIFSKLNKDNFEFYFNDEINTMIIFPKHIYENKKSFHKIINRMSQIYSKDLTNLRVPLQGELKTYY